jgi:hypothetical protein
MGDGEKYNTSDSAMRCSVVFADYRKQSINNSESTTSEKD